MKALTVQQPWAWAIFHGKGIENRSQQWSYRGPLAIQVTHLVLENPRILANPIPCKGALGLWTPPADVIEQSALDFEAGV